MRRTTTPGAAQAGRDPEEGRPTREPLPTRVEGLPTLPPSYHATVDAGLAALDVALPAGSRQAIDSHVRLLLAWTSAINLTAIREPEAVAREHVLDSLAAVALLRRHGASRLLDLGSGGGFPGLPLAVGVPAAETLLVEPIGKKAAFLRTSVAALTMEASIGVAAARAEALAHDRHHRGRWPIVTARAVAELAELAELALPLLARGGLLVAWKRVPIEAELDRARTAVDALGGEIVEVAPVAVAGLDDHRLVIVWKGRPTPDRYPRDPGLRRRRPL